MILTYLLLLAVPVLGLTTVALAHEVDVRRFERKMGIRG